MELFIKLSSLLFFLLLNACAYIHHVQVGEVDSNIVLKGRKFEILVSESGINFREAAEIGKVLSKDYQAIENAHLVLSLFQSGPRTGNHVFSEAYADKIFGLLKKECLSGRVSGLISIRETAKYPVVSGEIVKLIGYCKET